MAAAQAFEVTKHIFILGTGESHRNNRAAQPGCQVADTRFRFDQGACARARPFRGDDEDIVFFHQGDDFAQGFQVRVETVDKDEVEILSYPAEEFYILPLFADQDEHIPIIKSIIGDGDIHEAQVVRGDDETAVLRQVLIAADVHAGDQVENKTDKPANDITHGSSIAPSSADGPHTRRDTFRGAGRRGGT